MGYYSQSVVLLSARRIMDVLDNRGEFGAERLNPLATTQLHRRSPRGEEDFGLPDTSDRNDDRSDAPTGPVLLSARRNDRANFLLDNRTITQERRHREGHLLTLLREQEQLLRERTFFRPRNGHEFL